METCHNPLNLACFEATGESAPEVLFAMVLLAAASSFAGDIPRGKPFSSAKARVGIMTQTEQDTQDTPRWSDNLEVPDVPTSHWMIVDSKGNVYML